ncbi:MAG TPA: ribosome-associated translation inhibitor RaiA [Marinilabiliaceae bacterium]|jgi:putative sigma-54 modulation protein|nr:ribosome-associated translation inhibitor RaiA [Marinilabiliaceae bacterium]
MNITIQSVRFDATEKLEQFVNQKVSKLDLFFEGILKAEVILRLDKSETSDNKVAELNIDIPGNSLFAKKQSKSFEESVDLACDAIRKQLEKHKDKVKAK